MSQPVTRRRSKLAPDPDTRLAILTAATEALHEFGVDGLSIAGVLLRAGLSTRAFYRHFESKDQLVTSVFLELGDAEKRRLRKRMSAADTPADAVAAWIDARLDLAFSDAVKSEMRRMSLEAQAHGFATPELIQPAYAAMLEPLIDEIGRGLEQGAFRGVDAVGAAQSIQAVVWARTERQWATGDFDRAEVREHTVRFCLRGLGVASRAVTRIVKQG